MLDVIYYPNKILRKKTKKVKDILSKEFQLFIKEMSETMLKKDGLGLAANQVNSDLRICIINFHDGPKAIINPNIIWKNIFRKSTYEEGCLSFPNIFGLVKRPKKVYIRYQDKNGKRKWLRASGLLATVIQHEIDHLNGILFIDKIFKYNKGKNKIKELKKLAKINEL
ncbi:peptide deformylase [bacterium]|jgi:peptide deformylase|nr:peptide deformylase [bacterium]MBT4121449.1 peptide deformylase [bacterium]MBT4335021.1 peptide deformylase [bacterium]MBT4495641.1 peptide deformylase [bacterium]MBT4764117.1 peptide deformylase [bacterium]